MAIPNTLEPEALYSLVVNAVVSVANHTLKPDLIYTVKGKVIVALQALRPEVIVNVEEV